MRLRLAPLLAAAVLAACDRPAPTPAGNAAAPKETGYIARVRALAPGQRDGVLFRAIQGGGGQSCQGVTQVEDMPATQAGNPVWRVTCADGAQWSVALADDGTALVTGARNSAGRVR